MQIKIKMMTTLFCLPLSLCLGGNVRHCVGLWHGWHRFLCEDVQSEKKVDSIEVKAPAKR